MSHPVHQAQFYTTARTLILVPLKELYWEVRSHSSNALKEAVEWMEQQEDDRFASRIAKLRRYLRQGRYDRS
jgi:hypothetical protein